MRIMKCILISFIVVSLAFQGFLRSVFAANIAGDLEKINTAFEIHDLVKQVGYTEFSLKVKPLTVNEQVFLRGLEAKTHGLLSQAAGAYYDETYKEPSPTSSSSFTGNHPRVAGMVGGAAIGAFFGWLISSAGEDPKKSAQTGALYGTVVIVVLNLFH